MKNLLSLIMGIGIGASCYLLEIPLPAPSVLLGALLVVSMTLGYCCIDYLKKLKEKQQSNEASS